VMIDPFHPLMITQEAMDMEDPSYWKSWVEWEISAGNAIVRFETVSQLKYNTLPIVIQ
jgi:hypothetical protein